MAAAVPVSHHHYKMRVLLFAHHVILSFSFLFFLIIETKTTAVSSFVFGTFRSSRNRNRSTHQSGPRFAASSSNSRSRRVKGDNNEVNDGGSSSTAAGRRRRAVAAVERNKAAFARRAAGIKPPPSKKRRKNPRWEKEGDALYHQVAVTAAAGGEVGTGYNDSLLSSNCSNSMDGIIPSDVATARELLKGVTVTTGATAPSAIPTTDVPDKKTIAQAAYTPMGGEMNVDEDSDDASKADDANERTNNKNLWGTLPVGPVLKAQLPETPTPVQIAAFSTIVKGTNTVLASATGTGKSLAYLVPLLCRTSKQTPCAVMIVTPTMELALQLQKVVDTLYPPTGRGGKKKERKRSVMHVVGNEYHKDQLREENPSPKRGMELLPHIQGAPILAGTPRSLNRLMAEARAVAVTDDSSFGSVNKEAQADAHALRTNLRAVVLDEADRLLRTEGAARDAWHKQQEAKKARFYNSNDKRPRRSKKPTAVAATQTHALLSELPGSLSEKQIICASATVGRTLRRQLMDLLNAPSMDKAAVLITADARTGKDAKRRRSTLVPDSLSHAYRLLPPSAITGTDTVVPLADNPKKKRTKTEQQQQKPAQQRQKLQPYEPEEDIVIEAVVEIVRGVATADSPEPVLVFPGRLGVDWVQKQLVSRGLRDVRTLRDTLSKKQENEDNFDESSDQVTGSDDTDSSSSSSSSSTSSASSSSSCWEATPVHVVGDKFGRGLDLPGIRYVVLLSPPSSAAGYAHLAGRTGRNDKPGTAITLVRPREAPKLLAIANALGLSFQDWGNEISTVAAAATTTTTTM